MHMNARRANVKEPVEVEDPKATEKVEETPEVDDEPETGEANEEDVPPVPEDDETEVEPEDEDEDEDHEPVEPEPDLSADEYIPGQPCRKCGNPSPAYTNSYGRGCNRCLV